MCGNSTTREYPHNLPRNHRRFKNGVWQKPTRKGRGWEASEGLAGMTYAEGVKRIAFLNNYYSRDIENVTTVDQILQQEQVAQVSDTPTNPRHRRFNTVLNIWEKPNRDLTAWVPSGLADLTLEQGNEFFANAERMGNPNGYINLGAVTPGQAQVEKMPLVFGGEIVPAGDTEAFETFLNQRDVNPVAGEGSFAIEFAPVLTVLPNGGISLTVDARAAISLTRAVVNTVASAPRSKDGVYLAPLAHTLAGNQSRLFDDAVESLFITPFGG